MGIFLRLSDIVKSNINYLLDKAENPRLMLNQLILEMDLDYQEAVTQLRRMIVDSKKMELEIKRNESLQKEWEEKAMYALKKEREDLARQALRRKNDAGKILKSIKQHYEEHLQVIEDHRVTLSAFKAKISETKERKKELLEKLRSTERKKEFKPERVEITFDESLFDDMDRMEEKILAKQFEVEAEDELLYDQFESEMEVAFRKLERDDVDDELAALKKHLSQNEQ